ncbi:hypothetical protein D049_2498A, partial [Vibrio parahaemolyticus VPTS-2010]
MAGQSAPSHDVLA